MEDEEFTDDQEHEAHLSECHLRRLQNVHSKAGYRDGVSEGQESALQMGFNDGFYEAAICYKMSSKFRGCLSALLLFFNDANELNLQLINDLEGYLKELKELEASQPEIDHSNMETIVQKTMENAEKTGKENFANFDDVQMMMDDFGFNDDDDDAERPNEKLKEEYQNDCCKITEPCLCKDSDDKLCDRGNCKCLTLETQPLEVQHTDKKKKMELKYPFRIDVELDKLAILLRRNGISEIFIQKLRVGLLNKE